MPFYYSTLGIFLDLHEIRSSMGGKKLYLEDLSNESIFRESVIKIFMQLKGRKISQAVN